MLLYLDQAWNKVRGRVANPTLADLVHAIDEGAVRRVRPKIMTASVILAGLFPILWSDGPGSDVMKRIAAPMLGGIFTTFVLELVVYPAIYEIWKWHGLKRELALAPSVEPQGEPS